MGQEGEIEEIAKDGGEEGLEEVHHHRWFRHRHTHFMVARSA
jgi:hypothetical protein